MNNDLKGMLFVVILLSLVTTLLIAAESYFNWQEINALVDGAEAKGLDYQLTITNQITNEYIFETKAS